MSERTQVEGLAACAQRAAFQDLSNDALTSAHLDDDVHRELTDVVQSLEHTRVRALTALLAQARPGVRE